MGMAPIPTATQVAYQRTELMSFLHFGLNTFDGTEYGDTAKDTPSLFNPTSFDAAQWVSALKAAVSAKPRWSPSTARAFASGRQPTRTTRSRIARGKTVKATSSKNSPMPCIRPA